ncbi:MAG: Fmu (Sun) domain protein [Sphingobacteriales bacterium]|nr:Fmu (Sun) domain protein [Sphingobacteriales bacterium]
MLLPVELLTSLAAIRSFDREAFEQVHLSGEQVTSLRINPLKPVSEAAGIKLDVCQPVPWAEQGYYLAERPSFTFDPLFHAGCYYVQEASSMFLEQALKQTLDLSIPLKVLDLCASPGGKSTHIQSLLTKDSLLVSNEVIRSRSNVLKDNIVKWGAENVVVTSNDPKDFGRLEGFFDVIVVDAPCSGSGLFRRDPEAIREWSPGHVQLCAQRQQRILADAWPALKKDGILVYSTCSYSEEEDEQVLDWISQQVEAESRPLQFDPHWGIRETIAASGAKGYRFWPDKLRGEGFFIACYQKKEEDEAVSLKLIKHPVQLSKKEKDTTSAWLNTEGKWLIRHDQTVYAWPAEQASLFSFILEKMRVVYSGVKTGELVRDKLVPDHALAMSTIVSPGIRRAVLTKEEAIRYLQRKELSLNGQSTGWTLAFYEGHSLGWLNILPGRVNNYYPKELRILKDI